jgi:hypothetical protein
MAIITLNNNSLSSVTALPAAIATGKVLQVVTTTKTDVTSTTSGSFVDITGMSVSITPSSISSKILILSDIGVSSTETDRSDQIRLLRDATTIVSSANLFRITVNSVMYNASLNYVDSPSSTSALTYKLQWLSEGAYGTVYLNRRGSNATVFTVSTITAMEIAG